MAHGELVEPVIEVPSRLTDEDLADAGASLAPTFAALALTRRRRRRSA